MRLAASLLITLVFATFAQAQTGTKAIRFGKLWDGSKVTNDAVVVVDGDRITSVGSGNSAVPAGAQVIDLRKYTGIPGLIDLHTHITYYWDRKPGTRPRGVQRLPAVTVYLAQDNARRTLETGVTTIRDLNAGNDMDLAMRELIASGAMIGPRMFVSGPGLSSRPNQPLNAETVASLVGARVKSGVDWIKVFGSRGSYEVVDGTQTVSFEEMKIRRRRRACRRQEGRDSFVRRQRRARCRSRRRGFGRARRGCGR